LRYTVSVVETINVEVAYAEPARQLIIPVNIDLGTTVGGAIVQSGIMEEFPELDVENSKVGIFGKASTMEARLKEGDRVEIYRALIADPKEVRRQRAAQGKATKKGGDDQG
jgi:putative ubiquitin-RnfH superfamily antitoxin RatB of RatAB toxin-antitoxin module